MVPFGIISGTCLAFVVITRVLEWTHHLSTVKERWPKTYATLLSPFTQLLLLLVAISLLVDLRIEHRPAPSKPPAAPTRIDQRANDGTCVNVVAGNDAKLDCSTGQEKDAKVQPKGR